MPSELREQYDFRLRDAPGARWRAALLTALVGANNAWIERVDGDEPFPRAAPWQAELSASHADIRREWDEFHGGGGILPLAGDLFGGDQGNEGSWWRMGLLVVEGRPVEPLGSIFPDTVAALSRVPGLHSATWSVLGPGSHLPPHTGTNAGGLRLLIGVDCGDDARLTLTGHEHRLVDGGSIVFDDTKVHASENRGVAPRVLLLCDVVRPLPRPASWFNRTVQRLHHRLIPRFRDAPERGARLHLELNGDRSLASGG